MASKMTQRPTVIVQQLRENFGTKVLAVARRNGNLPFASRFADGAVDHSRVPLDEAAPGIAITGQQPANQVEFLGRVSGQSKPHAKEIESSRWIDYTSSGARPAVRVYSRLESPYWQQVAHPNSSRIAALARSADW